MTADHYWANSGPRYHHAKPGQGAQLQADLIALSKPPDQHFLEKLTGEHTEEAAWRKGAEGERIIGSLLDQLPRDRWRVIHDLTIGSGGSNLDHLVIGRAGAVTINTKKLSGRITLYEHTLFVAGHKQPYLQKAIAEAARVEATLRGATGVALRVWPALAMTGFQALKEKARPAEVTVLTEQTVHPWFAQLNAPNLTSAEVHRLEVAARTPETWVPAPPAHHSARRAGPPPPTGPRHGGAPPAPDRPTTASGPLTTTVWKRFGHHRVYVNDAEGVTIGYLDVQSGSVSCPNAGDRRRVIEALAPYL